VRSSQEIQMLDQNKFRFVFRDGLYTWSHRNEIRATDIDCTDMSDDEFVAFVISR
jgi:hypothetical protein